MFIVKIYSSPCGFAGEVCLSDVRVNYNFVTSPLQTLPGALPHRPLLYHPSKEKWLLGKITTKFWPDLQIKLLSHVDSKWPYIYF